MFCQVAEKCESMVLGGSEKVGLSKCILALSQTSKEAFVGGQSGVEVGSMLGELPALGFELEVMGDEGPVKSRHPVGNVVVLLNPGLVVGVVGCQLDGGVVVDVVMGMPIS